MIRLEMKNCNMILTEKQQKYQHYHLEKLINMNLTGEEILPSNRSQIMEHTKFVYLKSFRKTNRKTGWYFKVS